MKNWKIIGLISALFAVPLLAQAQIPYGGSGGSVSSGVTIVGTSNTTETTPPVSDTLLGVITNQRAPFSGGVLTNPLVNYNATNILTASVNATTAGYAFVSGTTGRTIYPGIPVIMTSGGNPTTATSLAVYCQPSGRLVANFPIAAISSGLAVAGVWSSVNGAAVSTGKGLGLGCASGDSVNVSSTGSALAGSTNVYINLPYAVQ
jgi:hypothetical protein